MPSEIPHARHGEHDSSQDKPTFSLLLLEKNKQKKKEAGKTSMHSLQR